MSTITPAHRFRAVEIQTHFGRLGLAAYQGAVRAARYWEGFQSNYTPEQIAAAEALIEACSWDEDLFGGDGFANLVRNVISLAPSAQPVRTTTDDGHDAYKDARCERGTWGYGPGGRRYRS
jgi:hypothetical protein